jgi:cell division protein FtsB
MRADRRGPLPLKKRLLLTLAVSAILALVARSLIGERGLLEVVRKKGAHQDLAAEVESLREENAKLQREIQSLRADPAAIERIAREELGYSKPGEITFLLRDDAPAPGSVSPRR